MTGPAGRTERRGVRGAPPEAPAPREVDHAVVTAAGNHLALYGFLASGSVLESLWRPGMDARRLARAWLDRRN